MSDPTNPVVSRAELSGRLRQLRVQAGQTLEDAADVLEVSAATVSRIETGQRVPRAGCAGIGPGVGADEAEVERLAGLVQRSREPGWWEKYSEVDDDYARFIAYEEAATGIDQFEVISIPALLQTADYGRDYLNKLLDLYNQKRPSAAQVTQRIQIRGVRQEHLLARSDVRFRVILREECLALEVGGPQVMRAQLSFLLEATRWPVLDLRVLPKLPASESLLGACRHSPCSASRKCRSRTWSTWITCKVNFFSKRKGPSSGTSTSSSISGVRPWTRTGRRRS